MPEVENADQALEQSAEDRIAAKFGITDEQETPPEETTPESEEEAPKEASDVEIEYEGERFKIPKQLEKAILQERDYTRKSQEVANERRQLEHERKVAETFHLGREFDASVANEKRQIDALENYLKSLESVDIRGMSIDDQMANLAERQRIPRQIETLKEQVNGKRAEFDKKLKEKLDEVRRSAREVLAKQIQGFNDDLMQKIVDNAKRLGFSEQDVDGIVADPRSTTLLYESMRWRELQSKKEPVKTSAPVVKPGSANPMPQEVKNKLAFHKAMKSAKTSQEKAKLIERRLAGEM